MKAVDAPLRAEWAAFRRVWRCRPGSHDWLFKRPTRTRSTAECSLTVPETWTWSLTLILPTEEPANSQSRVLM
jgi:hypothetical protein